MYLTSLRFMAVVAAMLLPVLAQAEAAPAQFSMLEVNTPDTNEVRGVRLAFIYGRTGNMTGLDFSIGLSELDNMTGVSIPLFLGANRVRNNMSGVALGLVNFHEGQDTGVNLGLLNLTNDVNGLTLGTVNVSAGDTLADVGFVNVSDSSTFQLAFFNNTGRIDGVQIGLLNCAKNGFFPCFPIGNFAK